MKTKQITPKEDTKPHAIGGEVPTNGAQEAIECEIPYMVSVELTGCSDMLFHRWNCEAVDEKARSPKNSKAKKTDNIDTYVYRMDDTDPKSNLAIPGEYFRMSLANAAKYFPDPRSPRKSAHDLFKAGVIPITTMADLGTHQWDYVDRRRAPIQRQGINRSRPAMRVGWKAKFDLTVMVPEYIAPNFLHLVGIRAGQLVGIGDFRPTFGRYQITNFSVIG